MILYTCEVVDGSSVVPNIILYLKYNLNSHEMELTTQQLMANKSRVDQIANVLSITYVKVGDAILPQLVEIKDQSALEGSTNLKIGIIGALRTSLMDEANYGSSAKFDAFKKNFNDKEDQYKIKFSVFSTAINSLYGYLESCTKVHKPYVELNESIATPAVKNYYDTYKLSVISDGLSNVARKSPTIMKIPKDKIYFPVHDIESVVLNPDNLERLDIASYIKPYKNRKLGDPNIWISVSEIENAGTAVAGSPSNNQLEIQSNELDFYNEFSNLFDSFVRGVEKWHGVQINPSDIEDCKKKAPKETVRLLEYLKSWVDAAAVVNWTHTGRVVVPGDVIYQYNLFDFIPFESYAEELRRSLDVSDDDDYSSNGDEAVSDDVVLLKAETSSDENVAQYLYMANFSNLIDQYIRSENSFYAYAEAIVKLFRWGEMKPTKLKLQSRNSYFNLSTCLEDTFSGCIDDYSKVVFDEAGHTRRLYKFIGNINTQSKPVDPDFFIENDLQQRSVPLGLLLFEQLKETGGLNFIFVDYLTFIEKFDSLEIAGMHKVDGKIVVDYSAFEQFEKMDLANQLDTEFGQGSSVGYSHYAKSELLAKASKLGINSVNIPEIISREPYMNDIMVDTTMCEVIMGKLKTAVVGETRDVVHANRKHKVVRPVYEKTYRGYLPDGELIEDEDNIVAYVRELNRSGVSAYFVEDQQQKFGEDGHPLYEEHIESYVEPVDHFYSMYSSNRISSKGLLHNYVTIGTLNMISVLNSFNKYSSIDKLLKFNTTDSEQKAALVNSGLIASTKEVYIVEQMKENKNCFTALAKETKKAVDSGSKLSYQEILEIWESSYLDVSRASDSDNTGSGITAKQSMFAVSEVQEKKALDIAIRLEHNGRIYGYVTQEQATGIITFYSLEDVTAKKTVPNSAVDVKFFLNKFYRYAKNSPTFHNKFIEYKKDATMKSLIKELASKNPDDRDIVALRLKLQEEGIEFEY